MADNAPELPSFLADAVKNFEGYNPTAAWDYRQYSNGYGTRAQPGETIDRATAEQRLQAELANAHSQVVGVNPSIPDGPRAALTSLTYNAGPSWINSGLGDAVRAGDWDSAKAKLLQYNKAGGEVAPGLVKRRTAEAAWFDGVPNSPPGAAPSPASGPSASAPPAASSPQGVLSGAALGSDPSGDDNQALLGQIAKVFAQPQQAAPQFAPLQPIIPPATLARLRAAMARRA